MKKCLLRTCVSLLSCAVVQGAAMAETYYTQNGRRNTIKYVSAPVANAKMKPNQPSVDLLKGFISGGLVLAILLLVTAFPVLGQQASRQGKPSQDFYVKKLELPNANGLVVLDYFAYDDRRAR